MSKLLVSVKGGSTVQDIEIITYMHRKVVKTHEHVQIPSSYCT